MSKSIAERIEALEERFKLFAYDESRDVNGASPEYWEALSLLQEIRASLRTQEATNG